MILILIIVYSIRRWIDDEDSEYDTSKRVEFFCENYFLFFSSSFVSGGKCIKVAVV